MRWGLLLLALAGCLQGETTPRRPTAIIVPSCAEVDASLWIDDKFVGEIGEAQGGVRLLAGKHRLEFRKDGFLTRYLELELASGSRTAVACELREDLR